MDYKDWLVVVLLTPYVLLIEVPMDYPGILLLPAFYFSVRWHRQDSLKGVARILHPFISVGFILQALALGCTWFTEPWPESRISRYNVALDPLVALSIAGLTGSLSFTSEYSFLSMWFCIWYRAQRMEVLTQCGDWKCNLAWVANKALYASWWFFTLVVMLEGAADRAAQIRREEAAADLEKQAIGCDQEEEAVPVDEEN